MSKGNEKINDKCKKIGKYQLKILEVYQKYLKKYLSKIIKNEPSLLNKFCLTIWVHFKTLISFYIIRSSTFLLYKNATIAIAFEICSFYSQTQIGENKERPRSLCSVYLFSNHNRHCCYHSNRKEWLLILLSSSNLHQNRNRHNRNLYFLAL